MSESYRSVFKQKYYEKLYKIEKEFYHSELELIAFQGTLIKEETIGSYDIEIPMLEPGEHFFLDDIKKDVIIKLRMRSSDGSIVYHVEDESIDTENTVRTLKECNEILSEKESIQKKYDGLKEQFFNYKNTYKYKHRWFNFTI